MREQEEWEKLAKVIKQWNNDRLDRLDLFEISRPDVVSQPLRSHLLLV